MESYTFQVIDSETKSPVSAVETYCMSATWQPSGFFGLPSPCYLPVNVSGYTNDSGMVGIPNVWVFQHLLFEKPGYEPVSIDKTWPQIAAREGSNRNRVAIQESQSIVIIPMKRKDRVSQKESRPTR